MIWNIPTKDTDGNVPKIPESPPVVQPPTESELDVINAICDKLTPPDGLAINYPTIRDILIGNVRRLLILDKVCPASEWLMKYYNDQVLFMPSTTCPQQGDEQPGEFEQQDASDSNNN